MTLTVAVGVSTELDGRQAGSQAAQRALQQVGHAPLAFCWLAASCYFSIQEVLAGIVDVLGDVPVLGMSTTAELAEHGQSRRSVALGVLAGEQVKGRANWQPGFNRNSQACVQNLLHGLQPKADQSETLFLAADGLGGDAALIGQALAGVDLPIVGGLASGDFWREQTYQVGGRVAGGGGLAGAVLSGKIRIAVGAAHGWRPVGALARLTGVQGQRVYRLDDLPANEYYARMFGHPASDWLQPPLSEIARLYPLGVQELFEVVVRSPVRFESDGSLRMHTALPEGESVELMVGSRANCLEAAAQAARQALDALGAVRPCLALVLVDDAWRILMEDTPGAEVQAIRKVLGKDVPLIGGYVYGQVARTQPDAPPQLLNQHILVVLLAPKTN